MLVLVSVLRIWFQLGGCESTRFVNILHCRLKTFVCVCMYLCMYNVYESISVSYHFQNAVWKIKQGFWLTLDSYSDIMS